jgi:hypothetical protein
MLIKLCRHGVDLNRAKCPQCRAALERGARIANDPDRYAGTFGIVTDRVADDIDDEERRLWNLGYTD